MFFLGVSAHLFIYFLVPAFLIACFYFKGIQGSSEMAELSPEVSFIEHTIRLNQTEAIYIFENVCPCKKDQTKKIKYPVLLEKTLFSSKLFYHYSSPVLALQTLRAPPLLCII